MAKERIDASEKHWGGWYLSKAEPLSLNFYPYRNGEPYDIELTRLANPNQVLSWINHFIESKEWGTAKNIRDFMKACQALIKDNLIKMPQVYRHHKSAMSRWGY